MSNLVSSNTGVAFLAFPEMKERLYRELESRFSILPAQCIEYGDLLYCPDWNLVSGTTQTPYGAYALPYWSKTTLLEPFTATFESIGQASRLLKNIQRNWAPYQFTQFRRASLIQEKLPYINLKIRTFPSEIPASKIGMYTLLDKHTLFASAKTTSFLPAGALELQEDHENPPSRAYLKIEEALIRASSLGGGCFRNSKTGDEELFAPYAVPLPTRGMRCFDAGGSPGGWTWTLRQLGCEVVCVDRAELSPALMQDKKVTFIKHDAFTLTPAELGSFDWVFSDIICYPERLLTWIHQWLDSGNVKNMICTIKMQGEIDWNIIDDFASIENSTVIHLNYNKHEFTWIHTT